MKAARRLLEVEGWSVTTDLGPATGKAGRTSHAAFMPVTAVSIVLQILFNIDSDVKTSTTGPSRALSSRPVAMI